LTEIRLKGNNHCRYYMYITKDYLGRYNLTLEVSLTSSTVTINVWKFRRRLFPYSRYEDQFTPSFVNRIWVI